MRVGKVITGFTIGLIAGVSFLTFNTNVSKVCAESVDAVAGVNFFNNLNDVEPLDEDELDVQVVENSISGSTQRFSFSFSTAISLYSSTRYPCCKLIIEDPDFTGEYTSHEEGEELPVYDAYLYSISGSNNSSYSQVIIPRTVNYLTNFSLHVVGIKSNAIVADPDLIESIVIHDDIEVIEENALIGCVEHDIDIYCCSASPKEGWASNWTDSLNVSYNYEIEQSKLKQLDGATYTAGNPINNGNQFFLGYYSETDESLKLPLV